MITCFKRRPKKIVPNDKPIVKPTEESSHSTTSSTKSEQDVIREFESLY
jgi:hypothetical protein